MATHGLSKSLSPGGRQRLGTFIHYQAGVAAAASEEAKENQYLDIVYNTGGDFIPLVWGLHLTSPAFFQ